MSADGLRRGVLAGTPTAVGSLPHAEPDEAVTLVLDVHERMPAAPELPRRSAREGMVPRWLECLPEVSVAGDGSIELDGKKVGDPVVSFASEAHAGVTAFFDRLADGGAPAAVKLQVAGPLTLGMALLDAGMPAGVAFERAAEVTSAWAEDLVAVARRRVGSSEPVLFVDEPALVVWRGDDEPPIPREDAVDLLSGVLAGVPTVVGVHVCGDGDRRMAVEAGPDIVGFPVMPSVIDDGVALARFLDAGGWIAWGAVPTDRPVGERADHWWNDLVGLWCDLTRGGCDPAALRTQSLVTPACGLAGHTEAQAERILRHCVEIGERVREQAVATRLSVGA